MALHVIKLYVYSFHSISSHCGVMVVFLPYNGNIAGSSLARTVTIFHTAKTVNYLVASNDKLYVPVLKLFARS